MLTYQFICPVCKVPIEEEVRKTEKVKMIYPEVRTCPCGSTVATHWRLIQ